MTDESKALPEFLDYDGYKSNLFKRSMTGDAHGTESELSAVLAAMEPEQRARVLGGFAGIDMVKAVVSDRAVMQKFDELQAELAAERAKVASLEKHAAMGRNLLAGCREDNRQLRATLAKVESERDAWEESASMACERAADDCTCAGCRYAAEVHAPKGTTES
jgi:hypothetical protein